MQRLLKRRKVQECLEETEKEMGDGGMSLNDLESLLNETGIDTKIETTIPTKRIAANNNTRFILINNVKQALADARKRKLAEINKATTSNQSIKELKPATEEKHNMQEIKHATGHVDEDLEMAIKMSMECMEEPSTNCAKKNSEECSSKKKDELEDDMEKAIKMSLECVESSSTSADISKTDDSWISYTDNESSYADSEEEEGCILPDMSSAKAYIMQYSDFTHHAINDLVASKNKKNKKKKGFNNVNKIIKEINKEASIIVDKVELSSDDEANEGVGFFKNNHRGSVEELELDLSTENTSTRGLGMNTTQMSVICVEELSQNVIEIDSSIEDSKEVKNFDKTKQGSDSESDEFEDVPELECKPKTVVQLILNTDDISGDDIFADIFSTQKEKAILSENRDNISVKEKENLNTMIKLPTSENKSTVIETNLPKTDILSEKSPCESQSSESITFAKDKSEAKQNNPVSIRLLTKETSNVVSPLVQEDSLRPDIINKELEKPIETVVKDTDQSNLISDKVSNADTGVNDIINPTKESITTEQLNIMADEIQAEEQDLLQEKGRLDRVGRNITEQMTKEAQELLQIFGIPYIVAPMEAEAQCAFLESIKLTDGTITDDSDIWLFGGRTVYKNFFNQKKHVLQFLADRIEKSFSK